MGKTWDDQEIRQWFGRFIHVYLAGRDLAGVSDLVDHAPMGVLTGLDEAFCAGGRVGLEPEKLDVTPISQEAAMVRGEYHFPEDEICSLGLLAVLSWADGQLKAQHLQLSRRPRGASWEHGGAAALPGYLYRIRLDEEWHLEWTLGKFQELTGHTPAEWITPELRYLDLIHPDFREPVCLQWLEAFAKGTSFQSEYPIIRAGGETLWVWDQGQVVVQDGEKRLVGHVTDISERRQMEHGRLELERRLLRAEKMESLELLVGSVAHDFNNLLAAMMGNLDLMAFQIPVGSPLRKPLDRCLEAASKARRLVGQMRAYSGDKQLWAGTLHLNGLLETHQDLIREVLPEGVRLALELAPGLRSFQGDAPQVLQVLLSLVANAIEAIASHPGQVTVRTRELWLDADALVGSRIEPRLREGWYVFLEVEDTGCGMSPETQARLFDPFFTTKFFGRGLGLPASFGIIRAHGGIIFVETQEGVGTCFRVGFPAEGGG